MRAMLLAAAVAAFSSHASYQGLWWKAPAASESGWGLNITHQGNVLFATWFTYDANGEGMWLVMPGAELVPRDDSDPYGMPSQDIEYFGAVYRTTGPAFNAPFNAAAVTVTAVGQARIRFSSESSGTFLYSVNGISQSRAITRQVFAAPPLCELGGTPGPTPNFQDLWWRAPAGSESGWGINLTHQGDVLFATWFTYDSDGRGLWLVAPSAARSGSNSFSGPLYRTRGPAFDRVPWDPAQVTVTQVGTATFTFSDANNGTFAYTVNGISQSKPITRQVFATPTTVCK